MQKHLASTILFTLAVSGMAVAQGEHGFPPGEHFQAGPMHMMMGGPEDRNPVKGIPLSAEIVNSHVQTLADGNKIKNEETSKFYRDAEGRTRRENKLVLPGQPSDAPTMIMINDPVAHTRFVLNTERKSADKQPGAPDTRKDVMYVRKRQDEQTAIAPDKQAETKEDLGTQTIDGFVAKGTRSSHTIPAGKVGNEKPITVTTESWYSDELGLELMRVHNDPWSGEVTTKVTNVQRGEQDSKLFTPPADYKVENGRGGHVIRLERHEGPGPDAPPPPPQD